MIQVYSLDKRKNYKQMNKHINKSHKAADTRQMMKEYLEDKRTHSFLKGMNY